MVLPCTCESPNETCKRAGVPMVGRLWELCSGNCPAERPCTPEKSEQYRELWDSQKVDRTKPCTHLGPDLGKPIGCDSCQGRVSLKVFSCAVHKECTIAKKADGVASCLLCSDYSPLP